MYSYLLEELSRTIGARLLLQLSYKGFTFITEPHLVGRNFEKQDCLLAWVTKSTSNTFKEPTWQTFELDLIEQISPLEDRFCRHRPGYDPYDNRMNRIYYRL
jgi:hypothetical protein